MVGFGSSLRMSRRRGWESAYLDYETLKLLLTQIEAVYEELNNTNLTHNNVSSNSLIHKSINDTNDGVDGFGFYNTSSTGLSGFGFDGDNIDVDEDDNGDDNHEQQRRHNIRKKKRFVNKQRKVHSAHHERKHRQRGQQQQKEKCKYSDYRDELFVESNSSNAFASSSSDNDEGYSDSKSPNGNDRNAKSSSTCWEVHHSSDSNSAGDGDMNREDAYTRNSNYHGQYQQQQQYLQLGESYLPNNDNVCSPINSSTKLSSNCSDLIIPGTIGADDPTAPSDNTNNNSNTSPSAFGSVLPSYASFSYNNETEASNKYAGIASSNSFINSIGSSVGDGVEEESGSANFHHSNLGSDVTLPTINREHNFFQENNKEKEEQDDVVANERYPILGPPSYSSVTNLFGFGPGRRNVDSGYGTSNVGHNHSNHQQHADSNLDIEYSDGFKAGWRLRSGKFDETAEERGENREQQLLQQRNRSRDCEGHPMNDLNADNSHLFHLPHNDIRIATERRSSMNKNNFLIRNTKILLSKRNKNRRRKKKRRKRRKKYPPHLQLAHARARAITERFLGLLRAEVEKVTLFAHSRMGELADTIGSLRFPSYDDGDDNFEDLYGTRGDYNNEHPLSDGGMHPSSSSSDEMGPSLSWSASDDERDTGQLMGSPAFSRRRRTRQSDTSSSPREIDTSISRHGQRMSSSPSLHGKIPSSHHRHHANRHKSKFTYDNTNMSSPNTLQQLSQVEQLRISRSMFMRSKHVVGEDFLLLSAVDEADAFTAVGVEMMHLLRFICVNAISVRKLCKKHDRLLSNRMLGGYYHRQGRQQAGEIGHRNKKEMTRHKPRGGSFNRPVQSHHSRHGKKPSSSEPFDDQPLLGRILRSSAAVDLEAKASSSIIRRNKLLGVYDLKIQKLANSTTALELSESLASALSEYEIARRRAHALSSLNDDTPKRSGMLSQESNLSQEEEDLCLYFPPPRAFGLSPLRFKRSVNEAEAVDYNSAEDEDERLPSTFSTSSSISLTRLRFVVVSVLGLREAARVKLDQFGDYLCRSVMIFEGTNVIGEPQGLDGCSRETLDFLLAYNPDAALLLDSHVLRRSLQTDHRLFVGDVMSSCLAVAAGIQSSSISSSHFDLRKFSALTISPQYLIEPDKECLETSGEYDRERPYRPIIQLNLLSCLLSTMNYYIVVPSSLSFSLKLGGKPPHSAVIIGATNITSLAITVYHAKMLLNNGKKTKSLEYPEDFRFVLIFCSILPLLGNMIHPVAFAQKSIPLAVVGRLLVGLSSAELINKQLIVTCCSKTVVQETVKLRKVQFLGLLLGMSMGSAFDVHEKVVNFYGYNFFINFQTLPGYIMSFLWLLQTIGCLLFYHIRTKKTSSQKMKKELTVEAVGYNCSSGATDKDKRKDILTSSSSESLQESRLKKDYLLYRSTSDLTKINMKQDIGVKSPEEESIESETLSQINKATKSRSFSVTINRTRRLVCHNIALPVTLALLSIVNLTIETTVSSSIIVCDRYFQWPGALSGCFLSFLALLVFPVNFVACYWCRLRDERTVLKKSLVGILVGLVIIINYEAMFALFMEATNIFREDRNAISFITTYYDWKAGVFQYCLGLTIIFISSVTLEGCTLALMSKVSSARLNSSGINCSVLVPLVRLLGRLMGDLLLIFVGLSHHIVNTDIINSLSFCLLCLSCAGMYVVKKHYFFLLG